MKGLDTNVLVRYLVQDDEIQGRKAAQLVDEATSKGEPLFVNLIVLCEAVWVLESAYGYSKPEIMDTIDRLLSTVELEIEDRDVARLALADSRERNVDFADGAIGRRNRSLNCDVTLTFDRSLKRLETFALL